METVERCQAVAKTTGEQCKLRPIKGAKYCKAHSKEIVGAKASKKDKAPIKKTAGVAPIDFKLFGALPKMAQIEILLNLDRKTLKNACRSNKEIAEICRQPEFRRRYAERGHPELDVAGDLFYGNINLLEVKHELNSDVDKFMFTLQDEKENTIIITLLDSVRYSKSRLVSIIYGNKEHDVSLVVDFQFHSVRAHSGIGWVYGGVISGRQLDRLHMKKFLQSIKRTNWHMGKVTMMKFLDEIKAATKSKLPWDADMELLGFKIHRIAAPGEKVMFTKRIAKMR